GRSVAGGVQRDGRDAVGVAVGGVAPTVDVDRGDRRGDALLQPLDLEPGLRVLLELLHAGFSSGPIGAGHFLRPPFSLGLLLPGAWAGLPEGNCPGGNLALEGAIRSSNLSISNRPFFSSRCSICTSFGRTGPRPAPGHEAGDCHFGARSPRP